MILFFLVCSARLTAQTYTPPKYKSGLKEFKSYLSSYVQLTALLPHERDYAETYTYTVLIVKDGSVKFANVLGKDLDIRTELKRVIRLSDKWQPGQMNGLPIDTTFTDTIRVCSSIKGEACNDFDSIKTIQYYFKSITGKSAAGLMDSDRGIEYYNNGRSNFADGKLEKAITNFETAIGYNYQPLYEPLYNMGVCYLQLNKTENACYYFIEATRHGDAEAEVVVRQRCREVKAVAPDRPIDTLKNVFRFVEVMPEFPGGPDAMMKFIQKNMVYPAEEKKQWIEGRVICRFVILEDGSITDVQVVRKVTPALDKEAIRVISSMPKFSPGLEKGEPVKVYYNLPVLFKLN